VVQVEGCRHTVIVYPSAYHDFDSNRRPAFVRDLVTGKNCDGVIDLDRFTVAIRPTGEDRRDGVRPKTSKDSSSACSSREARESSPVPRGRTD
jgi:hypothetical protein